MCDAITGQPHAMASASGRPKPSSTLICNTRAKPVDATTSVTKEMMLCTGASGLATDVRTYIDECEGAAVCGHEVVLRSVRQLHVVHAS